MKKQSKTKSKILAYILVAALLITGTPEIFSKAAFAAESAWKVVQSPTSVIEQIYCFDGDNYAGGKSDNAYKKGILADKDMNVVFQGDEIEPLMISSADYTNVDQRDYYGDNKQIYGKFSGYYEIQEEDTDGNTWKGIIDKSGKEIIPMKQDINFYVALIGSDGLIYFYAPTNNGNVCYNAKGKKVLSEKIVLQSDYIKEKFPNADSVEFDYYAYNGYVVLFIQTGRRTDRVYFEVRGNILDYPVAKEIVWKHCELNSTNSNKTDYGKNISSCLKKYLENEEEEVVSMLRAEGIAITDDEWDRDLEYFQMENKDDGENDKNTYWVGCVRIETVSKDWMYCYYIFDGDGNCVANGREKDTLYCWPEENGQSAGYSYRQGDYFVGYDCMGDQIFKVPIQDEESEMDPNIINVRPIKVNGESYYQYWDKTVGRNIWESKQFGILDESGKIIWDATYGKEVYKDRTMSRGALTYGKIVYEHTDVFDYEKWEYNYLDYDYVYDLITGEFLGKYDDCVVVSDDSLCIAYTDGDGVGHVAMYMKDGKEFEVTLDELTGAKQWSVKKIEGSDTYGFYGYKKASYAFPLCEKRGWAASPDTWKRGWNLGGQCVVIVDAQGNKLQSAVADSVYVNETEREIMTLRSGDYVQLPEKPVRTPLPDLSKEPVSPSRTLPDKTYTGFVNGIERTLLLKGDLYVKFGEAEFKDAWFDVRDCGIDQYGAIWFIARNQLWWYNPDLQQNFDLDRAEFFALGIRSYCDVAALVYEGSGSQAVLIGYESFSGEICPLLTFDEMKAIVAPESDISTPVYIPSQTPPGSGTTSALPETATPSANGTGNPSSGTAIPSVGTTSQSASSAMPDQGRKISSPTKVLWKSAKNIKGKKVALVYKKVENVKGYQIMYATDKKFKENKKSVFTSKTSYKAVKLKRGKNYYFRVRAYRLSGGKKIYGAWSGTKKIKVKK